MLTVFSAVLFGIVFFPLQALFNHLGLPRAWLFSAVAVLIFPLGFFLNGFGRTKAGYYVLQFTNGWFAALLLLVSVIVVAELLRFILSLTGISLSGITLGGGIIVVWVLLVIISLLSANLWTVKTVEIPTDKVKEEVNFVQLSDLHAYGAFAPQKVKSVFDRAVELNPDFIVVTGDMVDMPGQPPKDTFKVLDDVKVPIYYELGNHEAYVGLDYVRELVKNSKIQLLENEAVVDKGVTIVSVSDSGDKTYVEKTLPTIKRNESNFQVLLYHKPVEHKAAQENGIDLMLSGHTHAGQFFPVHIIVWLMYKYPFGTHDVDGMTLHTSAGSGTFTWPLRLFSTNEITHVKLIPK